MYHLFKFYIGNNFKIKVQMFTFYLFILLEKQTLYIHLLNVDLY